MLTPTVGRIVYFHPRGTDPLNRNVEPLAAIITRVWNDRMVNLAVFDPDGQPWPRTSVPLRQPEDEAPAHSFCAWMLYQVGKASRGDHNSESAEPRPALAGAVP